MVSHCPLIYLTFFLFPPCFLYIYLLSWWDYFGKVHKSIFYFYRERAGGFCGVEILCNSNAHHYLTDTRGIQVLDKGQKAGKGEPTKTFRTITDKYINWAR